jgi:hypothetical protein
MVVEQPKLFIIFKMFNKVAILALVTLLGCTTCAADGTACAAGTACAVTVTSTIHPGIADGCDIECESGCIADGMFYAIYTEQI